MKKESIQEELEQLSPLLRDLKRRGDGFQVPEGYFEAIEDAVFERAGKSGKRRKPALLLRRGGLFGRFFKPKVMWAAAAALALVLAATWLLRVKPVDSPAAPVAAAQELTEEEIESYVLENIHDFDEGMLADASAAEPLAPETRTAPAKEIAPVPNDPIDDLSDEELDLLLREMSDEELENLIKT